MPFVGSSDNLFQDAHVIFQSSVDDFEIAHKTRPILVWGAVPSYVDPFCPS